MIYALELVLSFILGACLAHWLSPGITGSIALGILSFLAVHTALKS